MSNLARALPIAALLGTLMIPTHTVAQTQHANTYPYIAIDVQTLGGPNAFTSLPGQVVSSQGAVLAEADTTTLDPDELSMTNLLPGNNTNNLGDPYISDAAVWRYGTLNDLGAFPGNNTSEPFEMNALGEVVGTSETGPTDVDPLNSPPDFPQAHAVVWKNGRIIDLGTLGGKESFGSWINDEGQAVGWATNTVPDSFAMPNWFPAGQQMRAFLWQNGQMRDLGTLGGPDSMATFVNDLGQVAGQSFTNATVNAATGMPTVHPFLWQGGHMRDLGTLGGTEAISAYDGTGGLNLRGEVIGISSLKGDPQIVPGVLKMHPFLWDGLRMRDLGTLGGDTGSANSINLAGNVVGWTLTSGNQTAHAFLWTSQTGMQDLGTLPGQPCTYAESINTWGQIVGGTCLGPTGDQGDGWLWEHGTLYNLNALAAPFASGLRINGASNINDLGEIAAVGVLPNGDKNIVLMVPAALAASEGLMSPDTGASAGAPVAARPSSTAQVNWLPLLHTRRVQG